MDKIKYDPQDELIKNLIEMQIAHPEDSDEINMERARELLPSSKRIIFGANIGRKLNSTSDYSEGKKDYFKKIMLKELPDEMYENLDEWFDDAPISDIRVNRVSIKDALSYTGGNFMEAAVAVCVCLKNGIPLQEAVVRSKFMFKIWDKMSGEMVCSNNFISVYVDRIGRNLPSELLKNVDKLKAHTLSFR